MARRRWAWLSEKEFTELLAQNCIYYDVPFPQRSHSLRTASIFAEVFIRLFSL
jgi:hypothetical protein